MLMDTRAAMIRLEACRVRINMRRTRNQRMVCTVSGVARETGRPDNEDTLTRREEEEVRGIRETGIVGRVCRFETVEAF